MRKFWNNWNKYKVNHYQGLMHNCRGQNKNVCSFFRLKHR